MSSSLIIKCILSHYISNDFGQEYLIIHALILSLRLSVVTHLFAKSSQVALVVKNLPANAGNVRDAGSAPGSGRSLGGEHGNTLQDSCLENPMDRGAWRATVNRVTESDSTEVT